MIHLTVDNYDDLATESYTHYLHKSESPGGVKEHEWALRYYQSGTPNDGRPKRHSGYHYNRDLTSSQGAGLGAGSYAQPDIAGSGTNMTNVGTTNGVAETTEGVEHVIIVQYWTTGTGTNPGGIKIFFNGVQTDADTMDSYGIHPTFSNQAVRLGRSDYHNSWIHGRVRRVGFWNRLLSTTEIGTLTSATNRAKVEGTIGSGTVTTAPTQPLNVAAVRSSSSAALATVTWTPPDSDGNSAITGYVVSHDNGGVGGTVTSTLLSASTRSYSLSGLPNLPVNISVIARNSVGDSTPGTTVLAPQTVLPLANTLSDNFDAAVDPRRVFDRGVAQLNGGLEWSIVDATKRGTYVRADMRFQHSFYEMFPATAPNTVTTFYVRSTADPTKQARVSYLNGAVTARLDDGAPDANPAVKSYNASTDRYWQIEDNGATVMFSVSADGLTWVQMKSAPTPTWLADSQVGVEVYLSSTL